MGNLRGYLLGEFRLEIDGKVVTGFKSRKARSLCAFLLLNAGRAFSREILADRLWGDSYPGDAMKSLRQEIWTIRSGFKQSGLDPVRYFDVDGDSIGATAEWQLDYAEFENIVTQIIARDAPPIDDITGQALLRAVDIYTGDLLPGLYDDWCLFPREALRDKFIVSLERLMAWEVRQDNIDGAIETAKRLLEADALLEHIHRALMRFYYAKGNRPAALRQYARCKRVLDRELRISPMLETTALYEGIRAENIRRTSETVSIRRSGYGELEALRRDLSRASKRLNDYLSISEGELEP